MKRYWPGPRKTVSVRPALISLPAVDCRYSADTAAPPYHTLSTLLRKYSRSSSFIRCQGVSSEGPVEVYVTKFGEISSDDVDQSHKM